MISQSALTTRHRPHPCFAQDFRREDQLASGDSAAEPSHLSLFGSRVEESTGFGGFVSREATTLKFFDKSPASWN